MLSHKIEIRVRFSETDKMRFVHHAKYIEYFEMGRTEMLRAYGLPYSAIEAMGYEMPVLEVFVSYKNAAFYDELLVVETILKEYLTPRVHLEYVVTKKDSGIIAAEGYTELVFIKSATGRAVRPPDFYLKKMAQLMPEYGKSNGR